MKEDSICVWWGWISARTGNTDGVIRKRESSKMDQADRSGESLSYMIEDLQYPAAIRLIGWRSNSF